MCTLATPSHACKPSSQSVGSVAESQWLPERDLETGYCKLSQHTTAHTYPSHQRRVSHHTNRMTLRQPCPCMGFVMRKTKSHNHNPAVLILLPSLARIGGGAYGVSRFEAIITRHTPRLHISHVALTPLHQSFDPSIPYHARLSRSLLPPSSGVTSRGPGDKVSTHRAASPPS